MPDLLARLALWLGRSGTPNTNLNLATNPAGGYRAFFVLACLAGAALVGISAMLAVTLAQSEGPPEGLVERERQLVAEQRKLGALRTEITGRLQGERTAEVLEQTAFLNDLLIRKGVSWTHTFLDLEQVLPANVRMLTISPEVAIGDTIRLDMTVSAKTPADFIEFLKALEGSTSFGSPALRGSAPPTEGDPTFRYQLAVEYEQQL